jgi:multidrug efflux system outer membrane protein
MGVSYAALFPSLHLTGELGLSSPFLSDLFTWKARLWQYAGQSLQYIYDGGRRWSDIEADTSRFRQGIANYQQIILQSFQEVEDALVSIEKLESQLIELEEVVEASNQSQNISDKRHKHGLSDYFEVIETQKQWLNAKRSAVQVHGNRFIATINLVKALAGGWEIKNVAEVIINEMECEESQEG